MVSGTCALHKQVVIDVKGGSRAAALKGLMTYGFTHMKIPPSPSRWDLGLSLEFSPCVKA